MIDIIINSPIIPKRICFFKEILTVCTDIFFTLYNFDDLGNKMIAE